VRKKRVIVTTGLVALILTAFVLWLRSDRITFENYLRIHKGMSRREVAAILGPPVNSGIASPDGFVAEPPLTAEEIEFDPSGGGRDSESWAGANYLIKIQFESGIVRAKLVASRPRGPSAFDKLLRRFTSLLQQWFT
jgi:hypothetical protein